MKISQFGDSTFFKVEGIKPENIRMTEEGRIELIEIAFAQDKECIEIKEQALDILTATELWEINNRRK